MQERREILGCPTDLFFFWGGEYGCCFKGICVKELIVELHRLKGDFIVTFSYLKGAAGKLERDSFSGKVVTGQGGWL